MESVPYPYLNKKCDYAHRIISTYMVYNNDNPPVVEIRELRIGKT